MLLQGMGMLVGEKIFHCWTTTACVDFHQSSWFLVDGKISNSDPRKCDWNDFVINFIDDRNGEITLD